VFPKMFAKFGINSYDFLKIFGKSGPRPWPQFFESVIFIAGDK